MSLIYVSNRERIKPVDRSGGYKGCMGSQILPPKDASAPEGTSFDSATLRIQIDIHISRRTKSIRVQPSKEIHGVMSTM